MDFLSNVGNEFVRQGKAVAEVPGDAYDAYMKYVGEPFDKGIRKVGKAASKGTDAFVTDLSNDQNKTQIASPEPKRKTP